MKIDMDVVSSDAVELPVVLHCKHYSVNAVVAVNYRSVVLSSSLKLLRIIHHLTYC